MGEFAGLGGFDANGDVVIVEDEGADGGAVIVESIVGAPAGRDGFVDVGAVVADDVAQDAADARGLELSGEFVEGSEGIDPGSVAAVGPFAAGEGGVATALEDDGSVDDALGIGAAGGGDAGEEAVAGAEAREGEGGGEELVVGGGDEGVMGVVLEENFSGGEVEGVGTPGASGDGGELLEEFGGAEIDGARFGGGSGGGRRRGLGGAEGSGHAEGYQRSHRLPVSLKVRRGAPKSRL